MFYLNIIYNIYILYYIKRKNTILVMLRKIYENNLIKLLLLLNYNNINTNISAIIALNNSKLKKFIKNQLNYYSH